MRIILLISFVLFIGALYGTEKDSLYIKKEPTKSVDELDSLYGIWFIENTIDLNEYYSNEIDTNSLALTDSLLKIRLDKLNSIISLPYNDVIRRFIELYAIKRKSQVGGMLALSEYYFPIFEEVLDAYQLPQELRYLPVIESALKPRAVSRAGASGLWQFMYATGKMYDLKVNSYVDDRCDPYKASVAAARFLTDLYNMYGDWTLVIAAYNCGPGNVNKAIRRSGGKRDFWEIYYRLPRETRGYVPAFIAANYIMHYYPQHGITKDSLIFPIHTDTIEVTQELHFDQVSEVIGIPVKDIQQLNPQYKKNIIPAKDKSYALKLPYKYVAAFIDMQDSIFAYKDSVYFNPEKVAERAVNYKSNSNIPAPPAGYTKLTYIVKSGDNIGFIASWYNVGVSQVRYWNNIKRNLIKQGQKIYVHVPNSKVSKYENINNMSFAEKQKSIGKSSSGNHAPAKQQPLDNSYIYYTVKSGDNFWTIAQKYDGITNKDIMRLNGITNSGSLKPGQKLKIKKKG